MTHFLRHITRQNGCDMTKNKSARHNRIDEYGTRIVLFTQSITFLTSLLIKTLINTEIQFIYLFNLIRKDHYRERNK